MGHHVGLLDLIDQAHKLTIEIRDRLGSTDPRDVRDQRNRVNNLRLVVDALRLAVERSKDATPT